LALREKIGIIYVPIGNRNRFMTSQRKSGFTLVELIIVVMLIGILAAIAIPRFSTSTKDARESTLKADLVVMRYAIDLYYHTHNQTWPGANLKNGSGGPTTTGPEAWRAFRDQLTLYSNLVGGTSVTYDETNYPLGPYLESIPINPLNGFSRARARFTSSPLEVSDIDDLTGWIFSPWTGQIKVNTTGYIGL
jgi:general secretion pathway protein G